MTKRNKYPKTSKTSKISKASETSKTFKALKNCIPNENIKVKNKNININIINILKYLEIFIIILVRTWIFYDGDKDLIKQALKKCKKYNIIIGDMDINIDIDTIVDKLDKFMANIINIIKKESSKYKTLKTLKTLKTIKLNKLKKSKHQKGGFYFRSLEDKGDKPITGTDLTKLLDEVQQFFYNAKYTAEGRPFSETDLLISLFRGDTYAFEAWLKYNIAPQYYMLYPPFFRMHTIIEAIRSRKYEDFPDYLLTYNSYKKSKLEYLMQNGQATPEDLQPDFFERFAHKADLIVSGYGRLRRQLNLKQRIIMGGGGISNYP